MKRKYGKLYAPWRRRPKRVLSQLSLADELRLSRMLSARIRKRYAAKRRWAKVRAHVYRPRWVARSNRRRNARRLTRKFKYRRYRRY